MCVCIRIQMYIYIYICVYIYIYTQVHVCLQHTCIFVYTRTYGFHKMEVIWADPPWAPVRTGPSPAQVCCHLDQHCPRGKINNVESMG